MMYFELYTRSGQWYWRLRAANHEIIAQGEAYNHYLDCSRALDLIKQTDENTPVRVVSG